MQVSSTPAGRPARMWLAVVWARDDNSLNYGSGDRDAEQQIDLEMMKVKRSRPGNCLGDRKCGRGNHQICLLRFWLQ